MPRSAVRIKPAEALFEGERRRRHEVLHERLLAAPSIRLAARRDQPDRRHVEGELVDDHEPQRLARTSTPCQKPASRTAPRVVLAGSARAARRWGPHPAAVPAAASCGRSRSCSARITRSRGAQHERGRRSARPASDLLGAPRRGNVRARIGQRGGQVERGLRRVVERRGAPAAALAARIDAQARTHEARTSRRSRASRWSARRQSAVEQPLAAQYAGRRRPGQRPLTPSAARLA